VAAALDGQPLLGTYAVSTESKKLRWSDLEAKGALMRGVSILTLLLAAYACGAQSRLTVDQPRGLLLRANLLRIADGQQLSERP